MSPALALAMPSREALAASRPEVHVGSGGQLFLLGGTNGVVAQYAGTPAQWWKAARWCRLLRDRARRAAALGIRYRHVVVPEKLTVHPDRLGGLALDARRAPVRRLARLARLSGSVRRAFVDLLGPLRGTPEPYLRTDSHWSFAGCHAAYVALCRSLDAAPRDFADRPRVDLDFYGDLGAKLEPPAAPERLQRTELQRDAVRAFANPLVLRFEAREIPAPHTGTRVIYRNAHPQADPRRLVLFGDSYANYAVEQPSGLLTLMLAETFAEVHFVWSASVDWNYVAEVRPEVLVTEVCERFMTIVPQDGWPVDAPLSARPSESSR